jgi:Type III flagellar switch regulator (C-ring) FliN C-term
MRGGAIRPPICVELDRQIQEPVDLLLAGRLAGGEIVVVHGNYGLRILEIVPSPPALTSSLSVNDELPCDFTWDFTPAPSLLPPCDIVMRLEDTRWECVPDFWPSW